MKTKKESESATGIEARPKKMKNLLESVGAPGVFVVHIDIFCMNGSKVVKPKNNHTISSRILCMSQSKIIP